MSNVTLLNHENKIINKPDEIANVLVKSMSNVSNFKNRSENFIRHKNSIKKPLTLTLITKMKNIIRQLL